MKIIGSILFTSLAIAISPVYAHMAPQPNKCPMPAMIQQSGLDTVKYSDDQMSRPVWIGTKVGEKYDTDSAWTVLAMDTDEFDSEADARTAMTFELSKISDLLGPTLGRDGESWGCVGMHKTEGGTGQFMIVAVTPPIDVDVVDKYKQLLF